jgi:Glycosyl transferase family 2
MDYLITNDGSYAGTAERLASRRWVISEMRTDNGMYDAVDRGICWAHGRIIAHLNSDQQYLPDTFASVVRYFEERPDVDVLFGHTLTISPHDALIAYRKITPFYAPTRARFFGWASSTIGGLR